MAMERTMRFEDHASLVSQAAVLLLDAMCAQQEATGVVSLCLPGGSVANEILDHIAVHAPNTSLDAQEVHVWWNWDVYEATDNPDRNSLQALSRLRGALPLNPAKIHPIPSSSIATDAEVAAAQYEQELSEGDPIDICLLEVGADGRIAGLVPSDSTTFPSTLVTGVSDASGFHQQLVTLTPAGLNTCRQIWLIASGEHAANVVLRASRSDPSLITSHLTGMVLWLVDTPAAAHLGFHHCRL